MPARVSDVTKGPRRAGALRPQPWVLGKTEGMEERSLDPEAFKRGQQKVKVRGTGSDPVRQASA